MTNCLHPNLNRAQSTVPQLKRVRFEFSHRNAASVSVAGNFNEWHPATTPMQLSREGLWLTETELAPGTYEYCLVVDGQWMTDPLAAETAPNPYGGRHSVLRVTGLSE